MPGYSLSASLSSTQQTTQSSGQGGAAYVGGNVNFAGPTTLNPANGLAGLSLGTPTLLIFAGVAVLALALIFRPK